MKTRTLVLATLLITLGWSVSIALGEAVSTRTGLRLFEAANWFTGWLIVHQLIPWPLGGLATGLALYGTNRSLRWYHVLLISAGFTVTGPLQWPIGLPLLALGRVLSIKGILFGPLGPFLLSIMSLPRYPVYFFAMNGPLNVTMGLFLSGLFIALVLRHANHALKWLPTLTIAAGWIVARAVALGVPMAPRQRATGSVYTTRLLSSSLVGEGLLRGALYGLLGALVIFGVLFLVGWRFRPVESTTEVRWRFLPDNPLFHRLVRSHRLRWPNLRSSFILMGCALIVGLAGGLVLETTLDAVAPIHKISMALMAYLFVLPFVVSTIAANLTVRHTRHESFELLRLTSLTDRQILRSFVFAALYVVRVPLALTTGLLPLFVIVQIDMFYRVRYATPYPESPIAPTLLEMLMASVGLWAANVLGAAIGVLLGFVARRRPYLAVGLAPGTLAVVMIPLLATLIGGPQASRTAFVSEFLGVLWFMLIPMVVSYEVLRAARLRVWESTSEPSQADPRLASALGWTGTR